MHSNKKYGGTVSMVSLNDKLRLLVDTLETHAMAEKQLPTMTKAMLRPAFTTLRTFLLIVPEEEVKKHMEKAHMLYEATVDCSHANEQEFRHHINELLAAWN